MTTTATASASAGFLPASLAALLSRPTAAAAIAAPISTRSVGSIFSAASFSPPPPAAAPSVHVLPSVPSSGTLLAPATVAALSAPLVAASTPPATTPAMEPYFDANTAHPPPPIGAYVAPAPVTATTVTFVLSKPDVFKTSHSETYVIFGEVKFDDVNYQLQTQVAEQFKAPGLSSMNSKGEPSMAAVQDDEEVDETGVDKKDIELVMMQASVSRSSAVEALKAADGDIVSAIMELTN
ncbi:Nascent polypeptide-associated complex subunit alpha-like protein [Hordeum vulgare]|nr:Nascent polypeptide-associated complex subunit alpha-like protein [Hordeum vulgare]